MSDILDQWHYFASPVYSIKKLEFLETVRTVSNDALRIQRKQTKMDEIYPVVQADVSNQEQLAEFHSYVVNTAWNLLRDQGYAMEGRSTYFAGSWVQEHHKYSSMEYHNHNDCQLVAFYFTECPNNPPKLVIHDPRPSKVMVDLPEQQIEKIKVGQPVSVEVDAYPNEVFPGKVTVISETLDPVMRRFQVRCDVEDALHKLRPEMYARISPIVDENIKVPRVPNTALFTEGLYSYIFVEQSPGVLQRRRVTLGLQDADFSYIKEGLRAGERVVTAGAILLNSELSGSD